MGVCASDITSENVTSCHNIVLLQHNVTLQPCYHMYVTFGGKNDTYMVEPGHKLCYMGILCLHYPDCVPTVS